MNVSHYTFLTAFLTLSCADNITPPPVMAPVVNTGTIDLKYSCRESSVQPLDKDLVMLDCSITPGAQSAIVAVVREQWNTFWKDGSR